MWDVDVGFIFFPTKNNHTSTCVGKPESVTNSL